MTQKQAHVHCHLVIKMNLGLKNLGMKTSPCPGSVNYLSSHSVADSSLNNLLS